jgi:hypothetical protein
LDELCLDQRKLASIGFGGPIGHIGPLSEAVTRMIERRGDRDITCRGNAPMEFTWNKCQGEKLIKSGFRTDVTFGTYG